MKSLKIFCLLLFLLVEANESSAQKKVELLSPDGVIKVEVNLADDVRWSVWKYGTPVLMDNVASMKINGTVCGKCPKVTKVRKASVDTSVKPVVPLKQAVVKYKYNELRLDFSGNWSLEFRAYDDGVAYRFLMKKKGKIQIEDEQCSINLPENAILHVQQPFWGFGCNYEDPYSHEPIRAWGGDKRKAVLPALIDLKDGRKLLFSESDLQDYPNMFLQGTSEHSFTSIFAHDPLEFGPRNDRSLEILKEADYIAMTDGTRSFPWRWFLITDNDGQLVENTMPTRLAPACALDDTSWIKPGHVSWDWWNGCYVWGQDVDFVPGRNQQTYQYYLDFASRYGIEYIIMDEFWARDTRNPFEANPNIDLPALIRYGAERGVGIILWLPWLTIENHMDLFATYEEWGIKGVKVDFMDRNDRWMTDFYERVAAEAARHHLLIDFHGSFKPSGLEYKYPNLISYEAVRGMEWGENCHPDNSIWIPFIRNAVGSMDFGGSTLNKYYNADNKSGTIRRTSDVFALATAVIFQASVQHFAMAPNNLTDAPAWAVDSMKEVPTTWDETVFIDGYPGKYCIMARRAGDTWYVAGINADDQPLKKTITLPMFDKDQQLRLYSDDAQLQGSLKTVKQSKRQQLQVVIPKNGAVVIANDK